MSTSITEVNTKKEKDRFILFPWQIYAGVQNWVPPLIIDRRDFLNPAKNPFFDHALVKLFIARDGSGKETGRIAAIVNHNHIKTHNEQAGFFGMFECINDQETARALLDTAAGFLRSQGLKTMRGPENLSVNDDVGLLVDGFEHPPSIMMPYNPPYYQDLIRSYGCEKSMDLLAYHGEAPDRKVPERLTRGAALVQKRYKFTVRTMNMKRFEDEVSKIQTIYNSAWEENWGAVAMNNHEFNHLAKDLKLIVDPDFCLIAEVDGEPVGFSLALPDLNQVLKRLNGRLLPFGILKLLWYKRKIDSLRIITMGVMKKYRHMGIDACFYEQTYRNGIAKGFWRAEMSWILENNKPMNNVLQNLGFTVRKRYRLYDYAL